jgi:hypothetical protein
MIDRQRVAFYGKQERRKEIQQRTQEQLTGAGGWEERQKISGAGLQGAPHVCVCVCVCVCAFRGEGMMGVR